MDILLNSFEKINLEQISAVSFQNRFDTKYLLSEHELEKYLSRMSDDYFVLSVNTQILQSYNTIYFDTPDLMLYHLHHNCRSARFKVRTREYQSNGKIFNEIKRKTNKGKTIKYRSLREKFEEHFDTDFQRFLSQKGFPELTMEKQLYVSFQRVTLVDRAFTERLTVDTGLSYHYNERTVMAPGLVILERKQERGAAPTPAGRLLREMRREPTSFSKYCMGIAVSHEGIRHNNFKQKLRTISKLTGGFQWS